jgi:hypothetical protein
MAAGATAGLTLGLTGSVVVGAVSGGLGDAIGTMAAGDSFNFGESANAAILGAWGGGYAWALTKIGVSAKTANVSAGVMTTLWTLMYNHHSGGVVGGCNK